jgi:hypothetical protein
MQPEPLGGVADSIDSPAAILEDLLDVRALDRHECRADRGLHFRGIEASFQQCQRVARCVDQRAFDDVLQLPNIPWPRIMRQGPQHIVCHHIDLTLQRPLPLALRMMPHTRAGMSSRRSRSGGKRIGNTFNR